MRDQPAQSQSSLLHYLPAIYQDDPFVGQFLLAFEKILLGRPDSVPFPDVDVGSPLKKARYPAKGLEESIAGLATYFDPEQTPADFLPWLAGWVALTLRADLDELRQRDFIAGAVSFYRQRGTRRGLEDALTVYTRLGVTVNEMQTPFQIGVHATIGEDTLLDGGAPHHFQVLIRLPTADLAKLATARRVAKAIIDMEKPVHTSYDLKIATPTFQIGIRSRIGFDTLLGPEPV